MPFSGIERCFKLPLGIPLSPTEIPLNGPMVLMILNGIQWYTIGSLLQGQ